MVLSLEVMLSSFNALRSKNGEEHLKNLATKPARYLRCSWPFLGRNALTNLYSLLLFIRNVISKNGLY